VELKSIENEYVKNKIKTIADYAHTKFEVKALFLKTFYFCFSNILTKMLILIIKYK
jgi:hypothetical protein